MELFPPVFSGFRGELRILSNTQRRSHLQEQPKTKSLSLFLQKKPIPDVCQNPKYASELAPKVTNVLFLNHIKYQR